MCGITGIFILNEKDKPYIDQIYSSVSVLNKRGPDGEGVYKHNNVALGHTRLSIIDTSSLASQPFTDTTGRYTIIFNGEFFNFKEHREQLKNSGIEFKSQSDTEVLLYLYIKEGPKCLEKINGFFAFAIYDKVKEELFIARDRMGVKPLLIYQDDTKFLFASEMKAIMNFNIPKEIDYTSLYTYLQLNYIPSPHSILKNVKKLRAGSYLLITKEKITEQEYYKIPFPSKSSIKLTSYENQKQELIKLLSNSVERRLVSDVPLGSFLSGGIDSSIIVALASQYTPGLKTFSIGFKNNPHFDETYYAELVANKYKTNHTTFSLTNDDLYNALFEVLDYIDEPFADSSALPVYILSKHSRKYVKVALSGDGADEMFAGYNKHKAELLARNQSLKNFILKNTSPLISLLPKSRNSKIQNKFRQLDRYIKGLRLSVENRYWYWCSLNNEYKASSLLKSRNDKEYTDRKNKILENITSNGDINEILYTDMNLVLQNDMLTKVDLMSMANSLEIRNPFLDYNVVEFAFSLPVKYKITKEAGKKILRDTFREWLPPELYNRAKQGFEVPLLNWFRTDLKKLILDDLLEDSFIIEQNIFNITAINQLKRKLFSSDPNEVHAQIWGLIVFQHWWKKYMINA